MVCSFTIDNKVFEFEVEGNVFRGEDQVLFQEKGNVLEGCTWIDQGFNIVKIFAAEEFDSLKKNIELILKRILTENNIRTDEAFSLEQYHKYVTSDEAHQAVISRTRFLTFKDFRINLDKLTESFSKAVGKKLQRENPLLPEEIVIMRISRPSSLDINPFHRDGYLDIWKMYSIYGFPYPGVARNLLCLLFPEVITGMKKTLSARR